jgi:predicted enzyme related to lactoylglutathione lyase
MTATTVRWVSAFLDTPADLLEDTSSFWCAVTGSTMGQPVGDEAEYLPLVPDDGGDPCLWLQRLQDGPLGLHPDLYVEDVTVASRRAVDLGATVTRQVDGLIVLTSPGDLPFCLVRHRGQSSRPQPVGPPGEKSILDQVCLDIPPGRYDAECDFWAALTGWELYDDEPEDEFRRLRRPEGIPYAFLLQRLEEEQPATTAHLDIAMDDRDSEIARHQALGAEVVRATEWWTVMRDPAGRIYCNTGKRPGAV